MVLPAASSSNSANSAAGPGPALGHPGGAGPSSPGPVDTIIQGVVALVLNEVGQESAAYSEAVNFNAATYKLMDAINGLHPYPATIIAAFLFRTQDECQIHMSEIEYLLPLEQNKTRVSQQVEALGAHHYLAHGDEAQREKQVEQLEDLRAICAADNTLSFNALTFLKPFEQPTTVLCAQSCSACGSECPTTLLHQGAVFEERFEFLRPAVAKAVAAMPFTTLEIIPVSEVNWNQAKPEGLKLTQVEATQKFLADLLELNPKQVTALRHIAIDEEAFSAAMWDDALNQIFTAATVQTIKILNGAGKIPDLALYSANYPALREKFRL